MNTITLCGKCNRVKDAAKNGHLECLKYLHEKGCSWDSWDEEACELAAKNGHLDCLKYLHEKGCPWDDEFICELAAKNGHLECLKYLYEKGCPWDEEACIFTKRDVHGTNLFVSLQFEMDI